jgi:quercetin dioxygenase-like cupin family protein
VKRAAGKNYLRDQMQSEAKLTAAMTEGRVTFLDEIWHPGFDVSPHFHIEHAETFYVLGGQVEWTVSGETHLMGPGDQVYIPPDTPHATRVVGNKDLHILMIAQPGGHEVHLEDEQKYTPEQRAKPDIAELLHSHFDYNSTTMPKTPVVFPPEIVPARGTPGPTGIRPAQPAARPSAHKFALAGKGEIFYPENEISEIKLTSADTDGRYSFADEVWKPSMTVEPHYHESHAEIFYVIDGQVEWTVGGEKQVLSAGDLVYIPPNTVHSVKVLGDKDEHSLMLYTPGGYEYYWRHEAQFTPAQLKEPDTQRIMREEEDFHPAAQK